MPESFLDRLFGRSALKKAAEKGKPAPVGEQASPEHFKRMKAEAERDAARHRAEAEAKAKKKKLGPSIADLAK